jgi:hypothetical protein
LVYRSQPIPLAAWDMESMNGSMHNARMRKENTYKSENHRVFAQNLRYLLRESGLTHEQAAKKWGIEDSALLRRWSTAGIDRANSKSQEAIRALAVAFKRSEADLWKPYPNENSSDVLLLDIKQLGKEQQLKLAQELQQLTKEQSGEPNATNKKAQIEECLDRLETDDIPEQPGYCFYDFLSDNIPEEELSQFVADVLDDQNGDIEGSVAYLKAWALEEIYFDDAAPLQTDKEQCTSSPPSICELSKNSIDSLRDNFSKLLQLLEQGISQKGISEQIPGATKYSFSNEEWAWLFEKFSAEEGDLATATEDELVEFAIYIFVLKYCGEENANNEELHKNMHGKIYRIFQAVGD